MGSRRKAREIALQMLFQCEVGAHPAEHVLSTFFQVEKMDPEVAGFARKLFEGALKEIPSLDRLMREQSENWRPERMAAVDRNILRLAIYELLHHPETPPAVVINEALEIARRFSGEDSVEFVNGVLDGIRKKLAANPAGPEPARRRAPAKKPSRRRRASGRKDGCEK
jgi:N utilization substance protein B